MAACPLSAGLAAGIWAWSTGRRNPTLPDHDTRKDLDRYQRLGSVLGADERATTAGVE
ncbi:hypothetical protein [Streptomyces sp. NPDC057257]|uniref:hypothetical protein n=1 Tax=Streptomyces sp. NPDC057257 TaxID=3346071 RepID=UPI0036362592